mmetsp:Transcript_20646/g.31484  ORF Transcript_20646/g.31484 Transcript_20646/m.31484 type:complete len:334 (+) Transcript_20646:5078-6079(+)
MKEASSKTIIIQLDFEFPIFISTGDDNDLLEVEVLDIEVFKSAITDAPILIDKVSGKLSSQMPLSEETLNLVSTAESLEGGMSSTVIVNFVGNLFLSGSLQYLWGMINSLQIVFHFPAVSVKLPGNAKMIYSQFIEITQFNLLPEEVLEYFHVWNYFIPKKSLEVEETEDSPDSPDGLGAAIANSTIDNQLNSTGSNSTAHGRRRLQENLSPEVVFDKSTNPNMNLADIGYGNYYIVENLETLLVLIEFYLLICLAYYFFGLLVRLVKKTKWTRVGQVLSALRSSIGGFLFWNVPFRFLMEGYLELMIDCLINIKPFIMGEASFLDIDMDAEE